MAQRVKIGDKVSGLVHMPDCQQVKKLSHRKNQYRLRIGQYRVIFDYDQGIKIITIEKVDKRNEHTY